MKTNRILSALLAALMLATTLLSCMVFPASAADETPAIVTDGLVSYYKGVPIKTANGYPSLSKKH